MQTKLQELTEKIYQEGISKANEEAEAILAKAREESKKMIEDAEKKASSIISDAEKKGEEIIKNGNSELKISFRHAVNTLKQELEKSISSKIVSKPLDKALNDENFVAELIAALFKNWKPDSGNIKMEALVPENKAATIEDKLKAAIGKELGEGLTIKPLARIKAGFEIVPGDGGFKISATGNDIEDYLKEFIRPKLIQILFEEN